LKPLTLFALTCMMLSSVPAFSQTKHRVAQKKPSTSFAEKQQVEIRAGREQIAAQIKNLTQFLFLFGGVSKGIEIADREKNSHEQSIAAMPPEQIAQSKAKVRESIGGVRAGLAQLESSFSLNPVLQSYYASVSGVAKMAQAAEAQTASNNFDQAGKSLIAVVNKLTDALLSLR
jgi:hypothetical protein